MLQSLGSLRHVDRFWHWLLRRAMGEVQHYYRDRKRERMAQMAARDTKRLLHYTAQAHQDGLENAQRVELSEIIMDGVYQLRLAYRNVLVLRCYEGLSFAEIGEQLDCKELRARVLFFRAKQALQRHLSSQGYGKDSLLTALVLFGFLAIPTKTTSAAACTVNTATLHVGTLATVATALSSKIGMAVSACFAALMTAWSLESVLVAAIVLVVLIGGLIAGLYLELLTR